MLMPDNALSFFSLFKMGILTNVFSFIAYTLNVVQVVVSEYIL